jgi:2-polyprenyl-6-methoxyphenol hydroxylase-like FAD-dependent oxidoreductase
VLESWLKQKCLAQSTITGKWGWKYLSHEESPNSVTSKFVDTENKIHLVRSKYLVGADGGSSRVRKQAGIKMHGGPL